MVSWGWLALLLPPPEPIDTAQVFRRTRDATLHSVSQPASWVGLAAILALVVFLATKKTRPVLESPLAPHPPLSSHDSPASAPPGAPVHERPTSLRSTSLINDWPLTALYISTFAGAIGVLFPLTVLWLLSALSRCDVAAGFTVLLVLGVPLYCCLHYEPGSQHGRGQSSRTPLPHSDPLRGKLEEFTQRANIALPDVVVDGSPFVQPHVEIDSGRAVTVVLPATFHAEVQRIAHITAVDVDVVEEFVLLHEIGHVVAGDTSRLRRAGLLAHYSLLFGFTQVLLAAVACVASMSFAGTARALALAGVCCILAGAALLSLIRPVVWWRELIADSYARWLHARPHECVRMFGQWAQHGTYATSSGPCQFAWLGVVKEGHVEGCCSPLNVAFRSGRSAFPSAMERWLSLRDSLHVLKPGPSRNYLSLGSLLLVGIGLGLLRAGIAVSNLLFALYFPWLGVMNVASDILAGTIAAWIAFQADPREHPFVCSVLAFHVVTILGVSCLLLGAAVAPWPGVLLSSLPMALARRFSLSFIVSLVVLAGISATTVLLGVHSEEASGLRKALGPGEPWAPNSTVGHATIDVFGLFPILILLALCVNVVAGSGYLR